MRGPRYAPGTRIGPYEIHHLLGQGGMAAVYLARARGAGGEVALKLLDPVGAAGSPGDRAARFEREVEIAARLDHPGCVRLIDHGVTRSGCLWLAMERLLGPTLRDSLAAHRRLPVCEVVAVGRRLCDALAHAHAAGALHRDVKPENIMYRGPGETGGVVLIDFGLSRLADHAALTAAGTCLGSPSYLAPERLMEHPGDARSDLYALGVVLYELLVGRPPFLGENALEIAQRHLTDLPQPVAQLRPAVPPALAAAVHCALEKDPDRRFARAETLAAVLEGVPLTAADDSAVTEVAPEWVEVIPSSDSIS